MNTMSRRSAEKTEIISYRILIFQPKKFLPARRYASAIIAIIVCLSVRLSQVGVLLGQLNLGSRKQRHTIAQGL